MSVTFETAILARLMKIIKGAIATRSTVTQLTHVTFRKTDDIVTMSASDLDVELTLEVPNAAMDCDPFTLEWAALNKFLGSADKGSLVKIEPMVESEDLETLSHAVELDGITATLDGFKMKDMPAAMDSALLPTSVVLPESELYAALDAVKHAISTEETRYYLKGVLMHADYQTRDTLAFAATDGHRLAFVRTHHLTAMTDSVDRYHMQTLVPHCSVLALLAALDSKSDSPVVVQWGEERATFAGEKFRLSSKLIDGTFPDYTRVIPRDHETRLKLDESIISKQVSRMMKLGAKTIAIDAESNVIRAVDEDNSSQRFSTSHDFKSDGETPEPFGLNAKQFLESLSASVKLGGSSTIEKRTWHGDPMTIVPAAFGAFADARFVLMPVKI